LPSAACCFLVACSFLDCSSVLKLETICSSGTSSFLRTTRRYNAGDRTLYGRRI
jgi:hypothetical protein